VFDHETEFDTLKGIGVFGRSKNGPGVVGKGGPGVVGLAEGQEAIDYPAAGVFGRSKNGPGVVGEATDSASKGGHFRGGAMGVYGSAVHGPGGWFEAATDPVRAQIHLAPSPMPVPTEQPMVVVANLDPSKVDQLPKIGRLGDLLATSDMKTDSKVTGFAFLWLCVKDGTDKDPAAWRQVLLGPAIDGRK
jgi:hypothetical protein